MEEISNDLRQFDERSLPQEDSGRLYRQSLRCNGGSRSARLSDFNKTKFIDRVIICDGFAGPGVYKKGEDGSPVIALKAYLAAAKWGS